MPCNLSLEWLDDRALLSVIVLLAYRFTTNAQDNIAITDNTVLTATVIFVPVVSEGSVPIQP